MKTDNTTKTPLLLCGFRALAAYAVISFFWSAFIAMGTNDNSNMGISLFADRLVLSNLAIAMFSAVYGFSLLIMRAKKLTGPAKYSLHILVNYIAAMICVYALFSNVSAGAKTWIAVILLASVVFFAIYGVSALIISVVKKKLK